MLNFKPFSHAGSLTPISYRHHCAAGYVEITPQGNNKWAIGVGIIGDIVTCTEEEVFATAEAKALLQVEKMLIQLQYPVHQPEPRTIPTSITEDPIPMGG